MSEVTTEQRAANGKRLPTVKEKAFSKEYAKTLNGTQSALAVYDTDSPRVADTIARDNLAKPRVREEIARILDSQGLSTEEIVKIHKRNMYQDKHLPTSQKAVETAYQLKGLLKDQEHSGVNVAFIINE